MKTPREILLARHQASAPKLDAIRREVVAELNIKEAREQSFSAFFVSSLLGCSNKLRLELILPCRRIWAGLAAVWILIFIVNVSQHDSSQAGAAKSAPTAERMMTFGEQQKLLNELFTDRSFASEAERPRIYLTKPRTEILELATA
jgi:hypothetical protein